MRAGRGRFPDVSVERFARQGSPNGEDDGTSAPLSPATTITGVSAYLEEMGVSPDTLEIRHHALHELIIYPVNLQQHQSQFVKAAETRKFTFLSFLKRDSAFCRRVFLLSSS